MNLSPSAIQLINLLQSLELTLEVSLLIYSKMTRLEHTDDGRNHLLATEDSPAEAIHVHGAIADSDLCERQKSGL